MSDKVSSIVRAVPKIEVLEELLKRMSQPAELVETGLFATELQELKIAIHLLKSIDYMPADHIRRGVKCQRCGREVVAPEAPALLCIPLCLRCTVWTNLSTWAEANPDQISVTSLRFHGHHYACLPNAASDDPVWTIHLNNGYTVVTTALRYNGKVPQSFATSLPDNCVLIPGNPRGLPLGLTRDNA